LRHSSPEELACSSNPNFRTFFPGNTN
jgi:hypothetical protein